MRMSIPALRVKQWLASWNDVETNEVLDRRPPPHHFFVMSVSARLLKSLSGVERRSVENRLAGGKDKGIQRGLEEDRAKEIARFVESGYPWSSLSARKREEPEFQDLKMPGWLPTAIVINVKVVADVRASGSVEANDLITFEENEGAWFMKLPESYEGFPWDPSDSFPIEVIDGQHRLWAFDELSDDCDIELPVVAFHGLDLAWQAYLFYVINIKPKKINTSLGYDLYPLLREQDWLERGEIHIIYREARAQELTEVLWSYPDSPWNHRINMLGEVGESQVRQASWVRSITSTLVKKRSGPQIKIGGLFGTPNSGESQWNRTDQAAILVLFWKLLCEAVLHCNEQWAISLRDEPGMLLTSDRDQAFAGKKTLLNTDQGVRGVLQILNDFLMVSKERIGLTEWQTGLPNDNVTEAAITEALELLRSREQVETYFNLLTACLARFDWRTSDAPGLVDGIEKTKKQTYRGSSGYKRLREDLMIFLSTQEEPIRSDAIEINRILAGNYEDA